MPADNASGPATTHSSSSAPSSAQPARSAGGKTWTWALGLVVVIALIAVYALH
ncbi:hypothetical protein [Paraburkholderia terrae]